jgi:DNA polymerase-3 subunit gamma/tau
MATTDPQKIPVTVLSRCLQFNLKQIPPALIVSYLQQILEREKISAEPAGLQLLARAAQGSMRDALSVLDQAIAYGAGSVTESNVRDMLGAVDQGYLFAILKALLERDGAALMAQVNNMASRSLSFDVALQDLAGLLQRIALAQTVPEALAEDLPERVQILDMARAFSPEDVQLFYDIALRGRGEIDLAPDEEAGFSMTLLRMLAFMPESAQAANKTDKKNTLPQQPALPAMGNDGGTSKEPGVKKNLFDGNWSDLVGHLKLGGMAGILAQHCELVQYKTGFLELRVPEPHKHLLEKPYQEKLKVALEAYLGSKLKIDYSVGVVNGNTPAEKDNREKEARQTRAIQSIEQDPFVRELVENFDARVIDSSIKPTQ